MIQVVKGKHNTVVWLAVIVVGLQCWPFRMSTVISAHERSDLICTPLKKKTIVMMVTKIAQTLSSAPVQIKKRLFAKS